MPLQYIINAEVYWREFMNQVVSISKLINSYEDVHQRFNLRRTKKEQFFLEWFENLPELTESEKSTLDKHSKIHSGLKEFSCHVCSKSFSRKGYLVSHIRTHTGEKPFSCEVCHKSFSVKGNLNQHKKIHSGSRNLVVSV